MGAGRATVSHPNSDFGENSSLRATVLGKMTLSNRTPCRDGGGCRVPNAGSSGVIFSLKEAFYLEHSGRDACIDGFHEIQNRVNDGLIADRGIKRMGLAEKWVTRLASWPPVTHKNVSLLGNPKSLGEAS
jgi:hypothetical protein